MKRIALLGFAAAVSSSLMLVPLASAKNNRPVLSGAMDICKIVDGGTVTVENGQETCCAQEVTEYDDGHVDFGANYCVTCAEGTDVCYITDGTTRNYTATNIKKLLKTTKQRQAPVTGN